MVLISSRVTEDVLVSASVPILPSTASESAIASLAAVMPASAKAWISAVVSEASELAVST